MQTLELNNVLSSAEAQRLHELERIVDRSLDTFLECGAALLEIRTSRLYRTTHPTFEAYCLARWGLSLSRCKQLVSAVRVYDTLATSPEDVALLGQANEHSLRPFTHLEPELQVVVWELVKHLEARPSGRTIEEAVTTIRDAIDAGWEERERQGAVSVASANGPAVPRAPRRKSDELSNFVRWANKVTTWDPATIVMSDDEEALENHLQAGKQLRAFCEALIAAIEGRLATF